MIEAFVPDDHIMNSRQFFFALLGRIIDVEARVAGLQEELAQSSEEARTTTAHLRDSCTALEQIKAELVAKLEASEAQVGGLQAQLQHEQEALERMKEELQEGEDIVVKWQGKFKGLIVV